MEWTWEITYTFGAFESVVAAVVQLGDVSYELVDASGNIVWCAPTGNVRNLTRGTAVAPSAETPPTA